MDSRNLVRADEGDNRSQRPCRDRGPVHDTELHVLESGIFPLAADKVVGDDDRSDGGDECIEDIQPAYEIIVEPDGGGGAERSVEEYQVPFGKFGDVG